MIKQRERVSLSLVYFTSHFRHTSLPPSSLELTMNCGLSTTEIAFRHNPQWSHKVTPDFLKDAKTENHTATVLQLPHPFGIHLTVTAFKGETITSLLVSGGHGINALVTRLRCDSPIAIGYNGNNFEAARAAFLESFPHRDGELSLRVVVAEFSGAVIHQGEGFPLPRLLHIHFPPQRSMHTDAESANSPPTSPPAIPHIC